MKHFSQETCALYVFLYRTGEPGEINSHFLETLSFEEKMLPLASNPPKERSLQG